MRLIRNTNQSGAAMIVGVLLMTFIVLGVIIVAYMSLTKEEGPKLQLNPPEISADDLLSEGNSNNELVIDTQIIEAAVKRDEEQRKNAEAALNDQRLPVGDGVTTSTTVETARLSQLQTEFIAEADRRLKALADLAPIVDKLTVDQKTIVNKLINDETTAITGLKAKAAAETTQEAFLADRAELEKEYVNYGLAIAQVSLLRWINDQAILNEKINVLGGKFQERLSQASNNGNSTASSQTILNGYQSNKATAKQLNTAMLSAVVAVRPNTYEANRAVLKSYYDQLAGAHVELDKASKAARTLTTHIRGFTDD